MTVSPSAPPTPASRVFLLVVNDTPEFSVALRYACRRAARTSGQVALLYVTERVEFQQWGAVEELMQAEQRTAAEQALTHHAAEVERLTGRPALRYVREGPASEAVLTLINTEPAISVLVLGAVIGPEGPGALVTFLTGNGLSALRVPLTIVPGSMTEEQLDAVT